MAITDPIGDMITRIRNAQLRSLSNVKIPCSKFREKILNHAKVQLQELKLHLEVQECMNLLIG